MTIPLRDISVKLVDKFKARFLPAAPKVRTPPPPPAPLDKPETDKFAKTVVPNAVRTISPESSGSSGSSSSSGARMVAMGRTIPSTHDIPPAVAVALEPRVERVVSLALDDVIDAMPEGYLKPRESFDTSRRVLVKAAEVERGMALGRPTISVAAIYQQMPEIFLHTVPASDASLVALPFEKVMDQLSNLHVRNDQSSDQVVPQVQTPFLQVTVEDTKRFGLPMEPIVTAEMPPVRVELATATSIAAAEPEPTAREKFTPSPIEMGALPTAPLRNRAPLTKKQSTDNGQEPVRGSIPDSIPFKLPAKDKFGTGEPAIPRVPASTSGPPVPLPSSASPIRIPFQPQPSDESPSADTAPASSETKPKDTDESTLTLPLLPILRALPPMQLAGGLERVTPDAKVSFRASAILPQLSFGKVVIKPEDFHAALPSEYRDLFLKDATATAVQLPLADVLANLPDEALRMRDDQEDMHQQDEVFETPFSSKAEEDAQRFAVRPAAAGLHAPTAFPPARLERKKPAEQERETAEKEPIAAVTEPPKAEVEAQRPEPEPLQAGAKSAQPEAEALKTEMAVPVAPSIPKFDAKEAIAEACALADVSSCSVIFADGLSLAGNIPDELHIDGLTAVAPTLLQRFHKHMLDTQLGPLSCITVHGEKARLSFFAAGNICLTAVQKVPELAETTRQKLSQIAQQLSETYSEPAHVDH